MSTLVENKSFLDSMIAKLIALLIACLLAFVIVTNWSDDIQMVLSGSSEKVEMISASEPAKPANPVLDECLEKRVGDVNRMKEEGILSDAQFSAFKSRAQELCRAQNPGG